MSIDTSHIVFIISNARSGSTMLRQLLNTNPAIGIPEREYGSLLSILKKIETYGDLSVKENFEKFYLDNENIAELDLKKGGFENTNTFMLEESVWFNSLSEFSFQSVYAKLLYHHSEIFGKSQENIKWLGDKSPQHIKNINLLIKHFPNAKYILLTRNPIDIALSQDKFSFRHYKFIKKESLNKAWKKLNKKDNKVLLKRIGACIKNITKIRQVFQNKNIDYIEVNYEALLMDSNTFFDTVSEFLKIDNEFDLKKLRIKESQSGTKKGTNELLVNNIDKYKSLLSPSFIKKIELVFGKELYKATDKKSTSIDLKSLNLKYNYWDTLNYIKNIFMSFIPVVGFSKTIKLVFKKYVSKKRDL
ncbi:sulfotransferase family protein [Winogradskyella sp. Asnod2-B02-A]|uniref:sulfotransferase family protein n=1 Tax=Winogradskyella sp. Asnod2-B02-A TaxID=3160583 RepID=UPI00386BBD02